MVISTAALIPVDGSGKPRIDFVFNPAEIQLSDKNETQENPGANNEATGRPKVSFAEKKATTLKFGNLYFDTYESGEDVIAKHIQPFKEAMTFVPEFRRPPVYEFVWGNQRYFRRCFVEELSYKLTMFLPDGTPVRAVLDVSLKEADEPQAGNRASLGAPNPNQATRADPTQSAALFSNSSFNDFFV
jgi:hypothetical protein